MYVDLFFCYRDRCPRNLIVLTPYIPTLRSCYLEGHMAPHRARNCLPDGRCRGRGWREPDTRVSAPQSERRRSGADRRRYIRLGVEHDPTLHRQSLRTDAFLPFGPGRQGGLRMLDGLATRNAEPLHDAALCRPSKDIT